MKCYTSPLAFAAATAMALCYLIGALLVILFPAQTAHLWAPLCYIRSEELLLLHMGISIAGCMSGIIQSFIYTFLYTWLLGSIYNFLLPSYPCKN